MPCPVGRVWGRSKTLERGWISTDGACAVLWEAGGGLRHRSSRVIPGPTAWLRELRRVAGPEADCKGSQAICVCQWLGHRPEGGCPVATCVER